MSTSKNNYKDKIQTKKKLTGNLVQSSIFKMPKIYCIEDWKESPETFGDFWEKSLENTFIQCQKKKKT